ncbi:hypothetical protein [Arthrobacter ramosus]|uniref:Uncharacterized protein n=1 Tax=Arthrobacter ramosus TaxID=1672 RepID=A0ABV5XY21_ARTRM|nr:hypothetical protein [Arthrobacter ramosus]
MSAISLANSWGARGERCPGTGLVVIATDSPLTHLNQQQPTTIHRLSLVAKTPRIREKIAIFQATLGIQA